MNRLFILLLFLICSAPVKAGEEVPSIELLLFLADFVDDDGNWDAPDMDVNTTEERTQAGDHDE